MKYDLRLKSEEITLTNKDGKDEKYVLYEATGTQRDEQAIFVQSIQKKGEEYVLKGTKENFLGMLLREKNSDAPVGSNFFIGFPGTLRDKLYEEAQILCGMKTEAELYKLLLEREMQKIMDKQEAEANGEEYIDPDVAEAEKIAEEEASGKE